MASSPDAGRASRATPVTDREELIYLLTEASELEHGLCCCYLFAAFSLKQSANEGLTASELDAVTRWRHVIEGVAVQEMMHLALASNLLTAIGASPQLRRPNFPQRSKYYPPSLQMTLRRFDEHTLDHFIFIERPEGMEFPDGFSVDVAPAPPVMPATNGVEPHEIAFDSVAELYRDIEEAFTSLSASVGEGRLFIGPPRAQATSAYFPFPDLAPVTDLASALQAIELIVEQGEGLRGDIENSHYARFLAIRGELDRLRAGRPDFEPGREVMENPFSDPPPDSTGCNLVDNPEACAVSDLFNAAYGVMLELLMRFFTHTEESDEELTILARTAVGLMRGVIEPLGCALTAIPATAAGDVPRAGASFALGRSITYLPHKDAAWTVFQERLDELAAFAQKVAGSDTRNLGLDGVHRALERASAALGAARAKS